VGGCLSMVGALYCNGVVVNSALYGVVVNSGQR
jgi:hypothetical protein